MRLVAATFSAAAVAGCGGLGVSLSTNTLRDQLIERGCSPDIASAATKAGFQLAPPIQFAGELGLPVSGLVMDRFYGNKVPSGLIPFEEFLSWVSNRPPLPHRPNRYPTYHVRSVAEATSILSSYVHARFRPRMCFRGQEKEYKIDRVIPNRFACDQSNRETLLLPSLWRAGAGDFSNGPLGHASPFTSCLADSLVYQGIDIPALAEKNMARYGSHTIDDLADAPDEETREYYRRYVTHKLNAPHGPDYPIIEQHYGIKTHGLDVTLDLATGFFFATHTMTFGPDLKARYERTTASSDQPGVVYAIVFEDPPLRPTSDRVRDLGVFHHIPPTRPYRQSCALPCFDSYRINAAACDIDAVFLVQDDFSLDGLPTADVLFPNRENDPFYNALLEEKARHPTLWRDVVEYAP